jgi:hypothetical protein
MDIAKIIEFSQKNSLDIAFRSGGHSQRGASSTDGGICVDLSKLCNVSVDAKTKQVTIQGGALWEQVYNATEKYGLALVGGICTDVGVGGYTLLGGYGWLTGAHGVALDSLLKAEVVLADSRIVTASESENADLFWALKGAGPCFGVVTSMVLQGYSQGPVWHGEMAFPRSSLSAVIEVANKVFQTKGEAALTIYWRCPEKGRPHTLIVEVFYNSSDESEAKEFFAPMLSAHPISNNATIKPFGESGGQRPHTEPPQFWTGGSVMAPIDVSFTESLIRDFNSYLDKVPDAAGKSLMFWEVHSFHGTLRTEQTATAFANRGTFSNVVIVVMNENFEENRIEAREWIHTMNSKMHKELARRKKTDKGLDETTMTGAGEYINYDGELLEVTNSNSYIN